MTEIPAYGPLSTTEQKLYDGIKQATGNAEIEIGPSGTEDTLAGIVKGGLLSDHIRHEALDRETLLQNLSSTVESLGPLGGEGKKRGANKKKTGAAPSGSKKGSSPRRSGAK